MHALAPATRRLYSTGQSHYLSFCHLHHLPPGPADDQRLAEFVTYLADVIRVAPITIKTYLAAVKSLHIDHGWADPLDSAPLTQCVLADVKRVHGSQRRLQRLPITQPVLKSLLLKLDTISWLPPRDRLMLRAACTLAFHGFLRCSEFTSNLPRSNLQIKQQPRPHLELILPASKTDPFRRRYRNHRLLW